MRRWEHGPRNEQMTQMLDDTVADLRRANAELQQRLDERTTERDEALDRETATAEVLHVINSSPGDLTPVFDTILQKAIRLCGAAFGILWTYDGELFHAVAFCNVPPQYAELFREPHRAGPLTGLGRVAGGEPFAHITDMLDDDAYRSGDPVRRAGIDLAGREPTSRCRCERIMSSLETSRFSAKRCGPSPTSRSH
jgi:hypothetical protein